jgi:lipid II:glycine glycyltransferase (peptidoglycan interpeptide bridge formation enzyme)
MQELNAAGYYMFPEQYYQALTEGLHSGVEVGLAWKGDEPVGAVLFFADRLYWHYHLGGTNEIGRKFGASTLLMCEAARRASQQGCRYLHMGGGIHGDDALLAYKKSFGGPLFRYSAVSVICDRKAYTELHRLRNTCSAVPPRAGFFPAYRA